MILYKSGRSELLLRGRTTSGWTLNYSEVQLEIETALTISATLALALSAEMDFDTLKIDFSYRDVIRRINNVWPIQMLLLQNAAYKC